MRVIHITASSMIGGGPEHVWQLVRHLPSNVQSFIAAPNCEPYGPRFVEAVGQERFLRIPQRKFTFLAFKRLVNFIKQNNIEIIHSHGKGAGVYGRLAALCTGAKNIHTFHGIHMPQKIVPYVFNLFLERFLCRISKKCIAVSQSEYEHANKLSLAPNKLVTIINGVQIPDKINSRTMPKPFNILHISRFDKAKNSLFVYDIAKLLHSLNILSLCNFILIGDGEQKAELEQNIITANFEQYFQFVGQQNSTKPFWENAGCLLSTSLHEGMPLAVLEAQAHGVPAILSNVVGNEDAIVAGETGFLYTLNDAEAAASCIQKILEDAKLWQKMHQNAYKHAQKNFDVQKMADACAVIYKNIA